MPERRSRDVLVLASLVVLMGSPTAAAADYYAAIAYSTESGAVGYSNDFSSRAGAENRALAECGADCEVVVWFKNGCGALATGADNGWGSAWATSRAAAETTALANCANETTSCTIERWVCTSR